MSALLVACFHGNMDAVKLLVEKNANIYIKDDVYSKMIILV